MQALPLPMAGGSIDALWKFINVKREVDRVLNRRLAAWGALQCRSLPSAGTGRRTWSAKSGGASILERLIDPKSTSRRSLPRDERNLFIAATNAHVLAFDNLSDLSGECSDRLCRLSTGGSTGSRQLFNRCRGDAIHSSTSTYPQCIEQMVSRPDLADRSIFITMEPISDDQRVSEQELAASLMRNAWHPRALLDAVSHGLQELED